MAIEIDYDLEPNELDLLEHLLPEFYNPFTVGPRFRDLNWEKEFKKDMILHHGFVVKTRPFKKKIKDKDGNILSKGIKEKYGIHSPLFGTDYSDDNAFAERYSCECGNVIGRVFEGTTCPKCGTKVKFVDVDLKMFAWLRINSTQFKIIHPLMYKKLVAFFGSKTKTLENMLEFKMDMTLDGHYKKIEKVDYKKHPYYGIGMLGFHEKFDEIMTYYYKKHKNKAELYTHIMQNKDKVFSNCVPVFSSVLRQVFFSSEDYKYTGLDKYYNAIFGNFERLNEEHDQVTDRNFAKINENLYRAQKNLNKAFDEIFTSIREKDGLIRRNILGGRINFSARTVITPNARLRSYQIEIPYVCAVELFKEQIVNILVKLDGETFNDAVDAWFNGFIDFSPKIYAVIEYILKKTKPKILLNRNPTINFGSFLCMNVVHVKKDYEDLSAGLPIACLSSLNADFDGDTLNIVSLIGKEFKKEFSEVLSPRTGFLLSKNDGKLNTDFSLLKDQIIALHEFCEV